MEENVQSKTPSEVVESKPKKKGKGCLIVLVIFLVILIGIVVLGYIGYKKIVSLGDQTSLDVTYTQEDFDNLWTELGTEIDPSIACLDCPTLTYTDPKEVDVVISNCEASAVVDIINENLQYGSISNSQVRFNDDGTAELSTVFTYEGQSFPVYLEGTFGKQSTTSVFGSVSNLKVGGVSLPSGFGEFVGSTLVEIANTRLEEAGVEIDTLNITGNGLEFDGVIPTNAY
jgi:hypothetical protein